jgi:hypothetical protein
MDDCTTYRVQIAHVRRCLAALQLLDLRELAQCAQTHGTYAEQTLISALQIALDTLPETPHE